MQLTIANIEVKQDTDGRYCLNDLHRAAGTENKHRPSIWTENQSTQALIAELATEAGIPALASIKGGTASGTYVCKELVYAYAMWISPSFHLKVIRTFDAMQTAPQTGSTIEALKVILKGMESTQTEIAALKHEMGEIRESIAWLPNHPGTAVPGSYQALVESRKGSPSNVKNPDNVLYKQFVKVCGVDGNVKGWWSKSGLKLSCFTITRILYQDTKPSPATFASIALALGISKPEIKKHLQTNYKNCGFLALL